MSSDHRRQKLLGLILAAWLPTVQIEASALEASGNAPTQTTTLPLSCSWLGDAARRLLARNLGDLSVHDEPVGEVVAMLRDQRNVPLSFIDSDEEVKISFSVSQATVQGVLDKIVAIAPVYRYDTIAGHVVLYPRSTKWEGQLEVRPLGPGPRESIASLLADQIRGNMAAFPKFALLTTGNVNSYVYREPVIVAGSGPVVSLLVQLLGRQPSVVFSILKVPSIGVTQLFLGGVRYWQALKLTSPTKLMRPGEEAQLKVVGVLSDGTNVDVTSTTCGTIYSTGDEKLISVTPDGMASARSKGTSWIKVENGDQFDVISVQVTASNP